MDKELTASEDKINVCHIASGDLWAGAEVQVFNILAGLKKLNQFDLHAIIMNRGRLYKELLGFGINVYLVDEKKVGLARQVMMIRTFIRENKLRIIHSHRYKENILSCIANLTLWNRCRLFKTQHGSFDITTTRRMRFYRAVDFIFTKCLFYKVIAVSGDISTEFCRFLPQKKVVTIHNSLQLENYRVQNERNEIGLKRKYLKIGIIGRLVKIKNIEEFIHIAMDLHNSGVEIQAYIAGNGPEQKHLQNMAESLDALKFINFLGNIDNVSRLYNGIDILFITSIHEGIPTVLLEAMYFGKIVISRSVGGTPEVIDNNINGFLYSSVSEAISLITQIYENPSKFDYIRTNAMNTVKNNYTYTIQAKKYMDIYRTSLLEKKQ